MHFCNCNGKVIETVPRLKCLKSCFFFQASMNCERHQEKTPNSLTPHRSKSTPTTPYVITVGIDNNFPLPPSPLVTQKPFPPGIHIFFTLRTQSVYVPYFVFLRGLQLRYMNA